MPQELMSQPAFRPVYKWLSDRNRTLREAERVAAHWRKLDSSRVPFCPRCFLDERVQVQKYCPLCRTTFLDIPPPVKETSATAEDEDAVAAEPPVASTEIDQPVQVITMKDIRKRNFGRLLPWIAVALIAALLLAAWVAMAARL